jgi:hypothetical protein
LSEIPIWTHQRQSHAKFFSGLMTLGQKYKLVTITFGELGDI